MEVPGRRAHRSTDGAVIVCDNVTLHSMSLSRAASGYCIDCRDFLCEDCYHGHRDHRPSRNHKLLAGNQMPKERLRPVDICHLHADEKITYFCKEHKELACQKCAFLKHRMCKNVSDITSLSSDPKHNRRYNDVTKKIAYMEWKTDNNRQLQLQNLSQIDTNKKQAKTDIKAFCKEMHEHLNKIESTVDEEVDILGEEDRNRMDTILQECDSVCAELKVITIDLETNQDPNRKDELFIALEKATVSMDTLDNKLTTLSNNNTVREYTFVRDERLAGVIAEVKTLGQLSIRNTATVESSQSEKVKVKPTINMDTVTIEMEDGINVRTQTDKYTCRITGSTMMEGDTTLAVVDRSNNSVKLVHARRKRVLSQIRLADCPWDITRVRPDQLAVTLPYPQTVQFLSVTGTSLSLGREMKVSGECRGIDYNNDQLYISITDPEPQVQILSMSGCILGTISARTNEQIQFICPYYLTLSVDRSLLYVSDLDTSTVYCLDNGGIKTIYQDQGLMRPYGVSAAEDGSLIVCDQDLHNVVVISSDCKQGKVLLDSSHGIQHPKSVLYNSVLSTLYVGQNNSDMLKVFKLNP